MDWAAYQHTWPHAEHSRFIDLPGQRWHVQQIGQGPVMLLLHGTGASTHSWRDMVPYLAQRYTLVMPDLPGHAFSTLHANHPPSLPHMSEDLRRLLAKLDLWPEVILGHSAGAAVAAHLTLASASMHAPVVVALNPAWLPQPGAAQWLFPPAAKLVALNPYAGRLVANHLAKPWVVSKLLHSTGSQLSEEGVRYYSQLLANPTHVHGVLSMMAAWNLDTLNRKLCGLKGPVLLHIGENDRTVPASLAQEAARQIPQADVLVKPGLGHLAHEEQAASTAQEIMAWLKQRGR